MREAFTLFKQDGTFFFINLHPLQKSNGKQTILYEAAIFIIKFVSMKSLTLIEDMKLAENEQKSRSIYFGKTTMLMSNYLGK